MDAQGNILRDEFIAQWLEQSWIYKAVINSLNDGVKASIALWWDSITLDGIIFLFGIIQEYVVTTNELLIIAYDEWREDNIKQLSKFDGPYQRLIKINTGLWWTS